VMSLLGLLADAASCDQDAARLVLDVLLGAFQDVAAHGAQFVLTLEQHFLAQCFLISSASIWAMPSRRLRSERESERMASRACFMAAFSR